ncbi:MAG: toll/interleukin-1 receptor domain-containing protein [Gammaproteobacteria bacterium]|nr:toll/interleukin-1 receptor domain-containing protein [Gammaproteobacteria bacterium]
MKISNAFGWLRRFGDFVFGYDFFLSYAHDDGNRYPRRLADQLQRAGFHVFLDEDVYVAGDDLQAATKRRIRMSQKLVLIARPKTFDSQWCMREVETILQRGQTPVMIDVNQSFQKADGERPLKRLLEDRIVIRETIDELDGEPSEHILVELTRSFDSMRVESRRVQVFGVAALSLFLLSIAALWQYQVAESNANEYHELCTSVVKRVHEGHALIEGLAGDSAFGRLIAEAASELANLPEFQSPEQECRLDRSGVSL